VFFYPECSSLCDDIVVLSSLSFLLIRFSFALLPRPCPISPPPPPYTMSLPSICSHFEPYFALSNEKLHALVKQFRAEMEGGLNEYGKAVAMVPSFVTGVPDGSEQG